MNDNKTGKNVDCDELEEIVKEGKRETLIMQKNAKLLGLYAKIEKCVLFAPGIVLGIVIGIIMFPNSNSQPVQSVQISNPQLVIKADYANPLVIEFILPEPIAPDFFVTGGSEKKYKRYLDDPEEWDPLGIGVDDALDLIARIRHEVPGVTDDTAAHGYNLRIIIAESHLSRKEEIIREITEIIQEEIPTSSEVVASE